MLVSYIISFIIRIKSIEIERTFIRYLEYKSIKFKVIKYHNISIGSHLILLSWSFVFTWYPVFSYCQYVFNIYDNTFIMVIILTTLISFTLYFILFNLMYNYKHNNIYLNALEIYSLIKIHTEMFIVIVCSTF
jgi:hypothetical protein